MSCEIDSDSFHGTKKGDPRRTARKAYRFKKRTMRNISRSLMLVRKELDRLYNLGQIPQEDYNILITCLSHYKEFMTVDKRFKI